MIKKRLLSVLIICFCLSTSYSVGAESADTGNEERESDKTILKGTKVTSEYEKAEKMIFAGKKLELLVAGIVAEKHLPATCQNFKPPAGSFALTSVTLGMRYQLAYFDISLASGSNFCSLQ